jgi:high-affinity nickel-transport protein
MTDPGILSLAGLGIALGLRHGIDWDHLAAITDITSAAVTTDETTRESAHSLSSLARSAALAPQAGTLAVAAASGLGEMRVTGVHYGRAARADTPRHQRQEAWHGFFLASMYALGHASLVVALGLLAIWFGTLLPRWIDPLMGRIVGLTLLFLGVWIIYSLVRYGRDFRLQSRWMVLIALARNGWERLRSRITGEPMAHHHDLTQYGPGTAFGIGVLHGVGAETGSQALLLAGAVGATTQATGTALLLFFALGLLMSNSLIAAFSAFGFVSASTRRTVYLVFGIFAAIFSLIVGLLFLTGQESALPDFEGLPNRIFGMIGGTG